MNTITRRQALKSGVMGVASLTIAERLLALGGHNEALASLKPTLAKSGYGPSMACSTASRPSRPVRRSPRAAP